MTRSLLDYFFHGPVVGDSEEWKDRHLGHFWDGFLGHWSACCGCGYYQPAGLGGEKCVRELWECLQGEAKAE